MTPTGGAGGLLTEVWALLTEKVMGGSWPARRPGVKCDRPAVASVRSTFDGALGKEFPARSSLCQRSGEPSGGRWDRVGST
jgi:hypothetical protein